MIKILKLYCMVLFLVLGPLLLCYLLAEDGEIQSYLTHSPNFINLSLDASQFTGEAFMSFPIQMPISAGNLQDKLKIELKYRSGTENSWLGKGWELEIGYIAKINKRGANNSSNPYILVLNGISEELICISGNQYKTKNESNLRIEYTSSNWYVWDKDGTQYKFENSSGGKWVLTKVTEMHGFSVIIDYDKPNNEEIYIKEIRYPEGLGIAPYCKINFINEARQDNLTSYYFGQLYKINMRLKEVQISVEGSLQKSYALNYSTDGAIKTSFLSSISERDRTGIALPETKFLYQGFVKSGVFSDKTSLINSITSVYGSAAQGFNMAIVDLNGDGLPDFLWNKLIKNELVYRSDWMVNYNTGNGFSSVANKWLDSENSYFCLIGSFGFYEAIALGGNATLADINGDNLPDLVYSKLVPSEVGALPYNVYDIMVRYNQRNKFSDTETLLIKHTNGLFFSYNNGGSTYSERLIVAGNANFFDVNGDGLADFVYNRNPQASNSRGWYVRLNNGSGIFSQEQLWFPAENSYFNYTLYNGTTHESKTEFINISDNSVLIDMNNDGLPDLVYNDFAANSYKKNIAAASYNWKVRLNTGSGFSSEVITYYNNAPVYFYYDGPYKASSIKLGENGTIIDINGDKLPDLVFNRYIGDLAGYRPTIEWMVAYNTGNSFSEPVKLLDSLCYYMNDNRTFMKVLTYNSFFADINKDGIADFVYPNLFEYISPGQARFGLSSFINTNPTSSSLLINHVSSFGGNTQIEYTSSANFNANNIPFILPVVSKLTKNPGIGIEGITSYSYDGGWYDLSSREFRGFRHVQSTDPLGFISNSYYLQDASRLGKPEKEENSVKRMLYTYKTDDSIPYFTPLIQIDEYTDSKCNRSNYEYDDYGNNIKTVNWGDIDISGDERSILTDYSINTSSWIINLPSRQRTFANSTASEPKISETQYFYDNNVNYTDLPSKGELTKIKKYLDTKSGYIQDLLSYDAYGNVISKTDPNGNITNIEYDEIYHIFPISITNAKGFTERSLYYMPVDSKGLFGQLKSKIDANNNEIVFEYDGFGRKTKNIGPYDTYSTYGSESYEYGINGSGSNYIITRTTENSGTSDHLIKTDILDGFERVIQSSRESENLNIYSYVDTAYNGRGEVSTTSLPYFKDGGLKTSYQFPEETVKWTQYAFDVIGRILLITKPDGKTVANSYNGWTTTTKDENNHSKILTKDAYGRLINVKEINNTEEYSTIYTYNMLDCLTSITDNMGNKTEYFYDSLTRRTRMVDPDLGNWVFAYDDNSNLIRSANAQGILINFTYDNLNRLLTKDYANQEGIEVSYKYDEAASSNGKGRRTNMNDLSGSSQWNFDKEGNIITLEKTIDMNKYKILWEYDAMGRIKSITFPNFKKVNYTYNNAGLTKTIDSFISNIAYDAASKPTTIIYANPITTNFEYYPENMRLKSITSGSLQDLRYEYDGVGNIIKVTDQVYSSIKNYIYDDLDRLLSGDGNIYEYSSIGNIVKTNGISLSYSSSHPHALSSDGISTYSYDNCGNMLSGAGRAIVYDAENRPVKITKGAAITQFSYDGDGKRVKKTVTSGTSVTTTLYIEDLYEKEFTQ